MQVFFESKLPHNAEAFHETFYHMGEVSINPLLMALIEHGLHPAFRKHRRHWRATRKIWASFVAEMFARPLPNDAELCDSGVPFWVCLRRAFPEAMTDKQAYERCLANTMLVYGAGLETTVNSISMTLAALALDSEMLGSFEAVCCPFGF